MNKPFRKPKAVKIPSKQSKIVASRVLIDSVPSSKALSFKENKVAARALAGVNDEDGLSRLVSSEIAQRPHVRDVLVEALTKVGVTPDKLARALADGIDAEETRFFQHEGVVMDSRVVKNWGARHAYLETALNLVGAGKRSEESRSSPNVFVFRSLLGEKPVDVKIGAPTDVVVSRRLAAAKITNRSKK